MTTSRKTLCSALRSVSRPENICDSAWRTLLPVRKPLNRVWLAVTPADQARRVADCTSPLRQQVAHPDQPGAEACGELRPIGGERLRHGLVGGALARPL